MQTFVIYHIMNQKHIHECRGQIVQLSLCLFSALSGYEEAVQETAVRQNSSGNWMRTADADWMKRCRSFSRTLENIWKYLL